MYKIQTLESCTKTNARTRITRKNYKTTPKPEALTTNHTIRSLTPPDSNTNILKMKPNNHDTHIF